MNYTELTAAIKAYTENDFPTTTAGSMVAADQIATFVRQAERRILHSAQILALRKNATGTMTPSTPYLSLPTDWLDTYSVAVVDATGKHYFLLNKDVNFIREAYPSPSSTGLPKYYASFDADSLILGPSPDDDYSVELHYFYYPNSIVDDGTSWLGTNFDQALLYGSLLEAYIFMKGEEDMIAQYQKRYDEALAQLKQLAEGKNREDNFRTMQIRGAIS